MSNTIESQVIGQLTQEKTFPDWWTSDKIAIPLFDGQKLAITFMDFMPDDDAAFIPDADDALRSFLSMPVNSKQLYSNEVYRNCTDCLNELSDNDIPESVKNIKHENEVWKFVHPTEIYVTRRHRRDQDIYIQVACECDWEEEHGLQLVFRQGKKLTRVSAQDGHITEADAYDIPDEEDELLSQF
ncbi:MAG: hypothetical protein JWO03_775 [Bacteroidetes bacterium]|nr:hypothetical protein [Bacteroidota bacterium]